MSAKTYLSRIRRICIWIKNLLLGNIRHMQPIDPQKIQEKLAELNSGLTTPLWVIAEGINAITTMTLQEGKIIFNPNIGYPVKIFTNTKTGEIKIFDARIFKAN